jgi:hypothetical protein
MLVKTYSLPKAQVGLVKIFEYNINKKLMHFHIFFIDDSDSVDSKSIYFFGKFNETAYYFSYSEFPVLILFGIFGGVLGALFVNLNYRLSILRMKLVL